MFSYRCRSEATHRGVPVLCVPYFLDQFTHCALLTQRLRMGVVLNPRHISQSAFRAALLRVLEDPDYYAQAQRVKALENDRPMEPRDLFLYWVNYTIRHQGAQHLVATTPFELNFLQYWSVDVVLFILGAAVGFTIVMVMCVRQICCPRKKHDKPAKKTQ